MFDSFPSMKNYQKISIYYFSGTGNSKNAALWFSASAQKRKIGCQVFNIAETESFPVAPPDPGSLVVFVSPVHGFNYPPVMLQFLSHFPKGNNDVVLMNTRAGMLIGKFVTPGLSGITFYIASLFLKLKGYRINGMLPVDLPSNWLSLHPGLNQRTVLFLHAKMKSKVMKFADKVLDGRRSYVALREIVQDILISPVALGYYFLGRFILAKTFFASSDCDNCGLCIQKCPVKAIVLVAEKPFWKLTCESCMRCMSSCPKRAIESAHGFILFVALLFNWVILGSISYLFPEIIAGINPFLYNWVIQFILFLGLLVACYRIMHLLKRYRWFNRILVATSLTSYKFWGRRYRAIKGF